MTNAIPETMTVAETALLLHVTTRTVYNMVADGQLRSTLVRRRRLIYAASVARLLR